MNKEEIDNLLKVLEFGDEDIWGHESWLTIGREQHGEYWWIAWGDCSNYILDPHDTKGKAFFGCPKYFVKAFKLSDACKEVVNIANAKKVERAEYYKEIQKCK